MSQQSSQPGAQKFKARKFRVATEGATTDGRNIERAWIEQMAASYDRKVYGARIWMEHLRGVYPDSSFRAYGDVLSLESREVEGGKLALFAEIEPLPDLVAMTTKAKQKIYTSIEVTPKFADTGKAYLTGLAVTDSPASLGTEVLAFAAQKPEANPFKTRKSTPDALFSEAIEQEMSFEPEAAPSDEAKKFSEKLRGLVARFSGKAQSDDERFGAVTEALEAAAGQVEKLSAAQASTEGELKKTTEQMDKLRTEFADLLKKLDSTDAKPHSQRPPATGGSTAQQTDC